LPPSTYREAIGDFGVRLTVGLLILTVFSLSLGTAFIPTFLEDVRGISPSVIATISAAASVGTLTFGIAVARVRRLQKAPFLSVAIAVAMIGIGFALFRSTSIYVLLIFAFYLRGGLFSAWAMLSAALGEIAPAAHRARAFAISEMVGGIAFALGPIIGGPIYDSGATHPFDIAVVLCLLLIPVLYVAHRRSKHLRAAIEAMNFANGADVETQAA
jgi:MFS family permease